MFNIKKLIAFIALTILFIAALRINYTSNRDGSFISNAILIAMYVVFILVGLYDIGKDIE